MAVKTILSKNQQKILRLLGLEKTISDNFYLTGGTALAEFYLQHRFSEDLDFFCEKEFEPQAVSVTLKKISKAGGIKKIDFQQSFNRNLFFLELAGEVIKTEFTYFPFPVIARMDPSLRSGQAPQSEGIPIDSLLDIAVNKIFTVYQQPRSRDFIDLYFIIQKTGWKIVDLVKKAKIKFDWHVDLVQLGARFMEVKELKDYPRMIKKIKDRVWQEFFIKEAKKLSGDILK